MPGFVEQLGMQAAGNAVGAGMGLLLQKSQDRRQIKQQQKLQDMQIAGQKQMGIFNREQQMQLWNDTNYAAQIEQMKKAKLSPGLIYGQGGAGGTTNAQTGSVSGAHAPKGGGEAMGMGIQMGQAAMIAAQIRLMEAQTNKTNVEAGKIGGVDTELGKTQIASLTQGIQESKTKQALTEVESAIKSIEETVKGATQNHEISRIIKATEIMANDEKISTATINDKIKLIAAEATGALISNALGEQKTAESIATVKKMAADIIQKSISLDQEQQRIEITKWVETVKANFPSIGNVLGRSLNDLIEGIIGASKSGSRTTHYEPPK